MAPFRDPPNVELGSLDVGLRAAAAKAIASIPQGGRLVSYASRGPLAPHVTGALGSILLVFAVTAGAVIVTGPWEGATGMGVAASVAGILALSLAAVLRAADRLAAAPTRSGAQIGRAARRLVRRWGRLATHAERAPQRFGARRLAALERSIVAARDADVAAWVPPDTIGRAELLHARALAALAGPSWIADPVVRARLRVTLTAAAEHLDDPTPARADLAAIDRAPPRRIAQDVCERSRGLRVATQRDEHDGAEDREDDDHAIVAKRRLGVPTPERSRSSIRDRVG